MKEKSYKNKKLLVILAFSLILFLVVPKIHFSAANNKSLPTFVLIYDQPWLYQNSQILNSQYRQSLLDRLSTINCRYVVIFIGYWEATDPANPLIQPTIGYPSGPQNYVRTPLFYQELIRQLHNINIQVLCWLEDGIGEMDITPSNTQQTIIPKILEAVNIGFDGYADDTENWLGKTGNVQIDLDTQIIYLESITTALHAIGKIHCPFTTHDWTQYLNPRLEKVDYNLQMFYGAHTILQDSRVNLFWQEEFGQLGRDTPPASPIIIGLMMHNGTSPPYDTMAGQIEKLNQLIDDYPHPQLHGFFIWIYEYMNDDDWVAWNSWVATLSDKGIPPSTPSPTPTLTPSSSPTPNTPLDPEDLIKTLPIIAMVTGAFAIIAITGTLVLKKRKAINTKKSSILKQLLKIPSRNRTLSSMFYNLFP